MKFTQTCELNTSVENVWWLLLRPSTLAYIAKGRVRYRQDLPSEWCVGESINLRPQTLFMVTDKVGLTSDYYVTFTTIDQENWRMETRESGGPIKSWRHTMLLEPLGEYRCRYTDVLDIDAGKLTKIVTFLAQRFYKSRHRNLPKLIAALP